MNDWLVLTGPTCSGKTELGLAVAERVGAEIVAMDSMTLYRGIDIATAKPTAEQRRRVPHHLIDVLDPWESASVAWWLERALACGRDIEKRGKRVLFVGGTPLYLKALLRGLFSGPPADLDLRRRLEQEACQHGTKALHDRLARIDPAAARRLHPNDLRRLVRALEVWELTGRPISSWQEQWSPPESDPESKHPEPDGRSRSPTVQVHWLDRPRDELYARINARVHRMFEQGLIEEVRDLRQLPRPLSRQAAQALGVKELYAHLDGLASLEATIVKIQTRTRQFAKRQITWFRHIPECKPVAGELTFALGAT
jgi:tRNA dimethylallyltransferase